MSKINNNNNNFDKLLKDKIFQYYYNKIYNDTNYSNFHKFSYEKKSIFLCDLFLFFNSNKNNKKINIINEDQNNQLKTEFKKILNKYSLPIYSNDSFINNNNNNNFINNIEIELNNNNNNKKFQNSNNKILSRNDEFNTKNSLKNRIYSYSKLNFDFDSTSKNLISNFNTFKENENFDNNFYESKQIVNFPIFKSKKNDIDDSEKFYKNLDKKTKNFYYLNYKSTNNKNKNVFDLSIFNNNIFSKRKFYSNFNNESKFFYSKISNNNNKNKILINDFILINQSINQESKISFREFNKEDLIERLFKCPNEKFITLNSKEAKKIGNLIIEFMRKEKEYEKIIEENNKKNKENINKINEFSIKNNQLENQINKLKNNYEIKKNLMQKYIEGITEKIDNTKEEFDEINNNFLFSDENLKNEILNEINNKLENLK